MNEQKWVFDDNANPASTLEHLKFWYDANSNLLTRQNLNRTAYSEIYHASGSSADGAYDKLNQIKSFTRGTLTDVTNPQVNRPKSISPAASEQSWGTIARKGDPHGSGLGVWRYAAKQTIALFHRFRRLRTRFDKQDDVHETFMDLGMCMICWRRLVNRGYFQKL